jgi:hypothetical protein
MNRNNTPYTIKIRSENALNIFGVILSSLILNILNENAVDKTIADNVKNGAFIEEKRPVLDFSVSCKTPSRDLGSSAISSLLAHDPSIHILQFPGVIIQFEDINWTLFLCIL